MKMKLLAALWVVTSVSARAEDVAITCSVAPGFRIMETYSPPNLIPSSKIDPGAPRNFVITDTGLISPWGDTCAPATISAEQINVNCTRDFNSGASPFQSKTMVGINRRLGTYSELDVITNQNSKTTTNYEGTCRKRETF